MKKITPFVIPFFLLITPFAYAQLTPNTSSGKVTVTTVRNVYSSTNVTTGAWVQLVASLSGSVSQIDIFDSSGQTLELGVGGAGSETRKAIVVPGGNDATPISYSQGDRVSIRAISGTASVGELDLNLFR